jgi:phosphoribosylamine---glycine ligase
MTSSPDTPTVLIIGKDARTDALAEACSASPQSPRIFALTEMLIPGLVEKCEQVLVVPSLLDPSVLAGVVAQVRPDLAIIGPEEPLAAGYADALRALGVPVFGPSQRLAMIESSKAWARELLRTHDIPGNPEYRVFNTDAGLQDYLEALGTFVVKPDGLTAGKGVRVFGEHLHSIDEAMEYARSVLAAHGQVQIEEKLEGQEFSLQTITDGTTWIHCPLVQDHKRAYEEDTGPNTGGMGSYSCADFSLPFLEPSDVAAAHAITEQVIHALAEATGEPYIGVLYGGFMATRDGVRLIEYNCRFGDPEAMNVLPLLRADFVELCMAAAAGELRRVEYSFDAKATVCKYIVPEAYPSPSPVPHPISVPDDVRAASDVRWYWAASQQVGEDVFMTSSRAGAFIGIGDSLEEAERVAERAAQNLAELSGGVRHRADIGRSKVIAARVDHMRELRGHAAVGPHRK